MDAGSTGLYLQLTRLRLYALVAFLSSVCILTAGVMNAVAFQGFTLGPGRFVVPPQGDWTEQQQYWPLVSIDVSPDGNLSGRARKDIKTGPDAGGYVRITTYDISVAGRFDESTGSFSGNFTITREWDRQRNAKEIVSKYHQVGEGTFSGKFTAQNAGASTVRLSFDGTESYNITTDISQNGRDNGPSSRNVGKRTEVVDFPIQGAIPVAQSQQLKDSGAGFSGLAGMVEWRPDNDEEAWRFAKYGDVLPVDAHIRTGEDSTAIISFADMTSFTLKPGSEIVISSPAAKDDQVKILLGDLMVNVKKMMKDGSMEIE